MNTVQNGKGDRARNNYGPKWYEGYGAINWQRPEFPETPLSPGRLPCLRQSFVLHNPLGLHARPAAMLIQAIRGFDCEVTVEHDGRSISARSILGLLSLGAGPNATLHLTLSGPQAPQALATLQHLFDTNFRHVDHK